MRAVRAREEITKRWEEERENLGRKGRTLISAKELSETLRLRERGRVMDRDERAGTAEGKACCCLEVLTSLGVYDQRGTTV